MRILIAVTALMLLLAAPARAENILVTTFADAADPTTCSLRDAIDAANGNAVVDTCPAGEAGATDTIQLPAGPYVLANGAAGDLDVLAGGPLEIVGAGAATTSISAQGLGDRVLDV